MARRKPVSTNELIQQVYRMATGELDDTVVSDNEDGKTVLSVVNQQVDYYHNSVDQYGARVIWSRNIDPDYIVAESDGTSSDFSIDWDEVQALTDGLYFPIRIELKDGSSSRYDLVPFIDLYDSCYTGKNVCAISSTGLMFNSPPPAGEIKYPCVPYGSHLVGGEKDVETATGVHNVQWLIYASAAEYVRTDIVRGDQYPNVLAQANDIYTRMLSDNEARTTPLVRDESGFSSVSYDW